MSSGSEDESDGGGEYVVERVVDRRYNPDKGNQVEYLLKWMGYASDENTWEAEGGINSKAMIADFEEKRKAKKKEKKDKERKDPERDRKKEDKPPKHSSASGDKKEKSEKEKSSSSSKHHSSSSGKDKSSDKHRSSKDKSEQPAAADAKAATDKHKSSSAGDSGKRSRGDSTSAGDDRKRGDSTSAGDDRKRGDSTSAGDDRKRRGFERGLEPDLIVGAFNDNRELKFLMKWKDGATGYEADLVSAKEANKQCPQTVIKFYESKLDWYDMDDAELKKWGNAGVGKENGSGGGGGGGADKVDEGDPKGKKKDDEGDEKLDRSLGDDVVDCTVSASDLFT